MISKKIVAIVTPYYNGVVDMQSMHRYIEFIKTQTPFTMILALGSTGDQLALSETEKFELITELTGRHQDIAFMFGINAPSTAQVQSLVEKVNQCMPKPAIMLGVPPYCLPNQTEIEAYIQTILARVDTDVLLYNNARRTGVNIETDTINRLFRQHEQLKALKEVGTNQLATLAVPFLYTGFDSAMIDQPVDGCTSVIGNILPYTSAYFLTKGQQHTAQFEGNYRKLIADLSEIGLVKVIKYYLNLRGVIASAEMRAPLQACTDTEMIQLQSYLPMIEALEEEAKYIHMVK